MRLYDELTPWYRLIDPPQDHADEAAAYVRALRSAIKGRAETLLELGSGAGHNALFMKEHFRCTLTDVSPRMLALSRELNPDCEHLAGDMRTVRLQREFDAVFVHDAVCYITTLDDLRRVADTAFVHTRPGGAALFAPDYVRERFGDTSVPMAYDKEGKSIRGVEWAWDPDPTDTQYRVDYLLLLRDGGAVSPVHDVHDEGLFSIAQWTSVLEGAGFGVTLVERPLDEAGQTDRVFVGRR